MADAFSPEQLEALQALMGTSVNNILTARLKTSEKQLLEKTSTTIAEALKAQLPDLLKEFRPADPPPEGKDGKKGQRAEDVVEMATMRKMIDDLRKTSDAAVERARASEARRRESDRQKIVGERLEKGGVTDPFKRELALAYLDKKQKVAWSGDEEDASLLWNDDGNQVSFDEGFASWLKTEEVKHFLPPTGAKGSGSTPVRGAPAAGGKPSAEQRAEAVFGSLRDAFQNQM